MQISGIKWNLLTVLPSPFRPQPRFPPQLYPLLLPALKVCDIEKPNFICFLFFLKSSHGFSSWKRSPPPPPPPPPSPPTFVFLNFVGKLYPLFKAPHTPLWIHLYSSVRINQFLFFKNTQVLLFCMVWGGGEVTALTLKHTDAWARFSLVQIPTLLLRAIQPRQVTQPPWPSASSLQNAKNKGALLGG